MTRSSYLKAMGIDVWTSRAAVESSAVGPDPAISPLSRPSPKHLETPAANGGAAAATPRELTGATTTDKEIPEFMLALFHYESVGLCLSLKTERELPKRFCDDVARTMGGNIEAVRYQLLKWPMLSTSGIDQSINAAREVVTQKFRQLPNRVMIFGEDVGEYYNPLRDLSPLNVGVVGAQTYLMVPSMSELLESGPAKRELMLVMHQWRNSEIP